MKKILFKLTLLLSVAVLFSSCLKDNTLVGPDSPNSTGAIIDFANPAYIASGSSSLTVTLARYEFLTLAPTGDKVHVEVEYTGTGKAAPSDVTVNLTTDATALATHLTQAGKTAYVALPATYYTMPASVTIPAGQNKVGFDLVLQTSQFTAATTYAIALKIASASAGTISGNFGTIVLALKRAS